MPARRQRAPAHSLRVRLRAALLRGSARIERHTLLLGLGLAGIGALIGGFAWLSSNGPPFAGRYPFTVILPVGSPPLPRAAQVRIAGKVAGAVSTVQPRAGSLRVGAYLYSSFGPLGRGARVHVGVLIGTTLVYLVVYPGDYHHPLPAGSVIPEDRVTVSSSLPQALQAFNSATQAALARNVTVLGEGWLGRGEQTNLAIGEEPSATRQGTSLLRAMVPAPGVLARMIGALATVTGALRGQRADDPGAATTAQAGFFSTLAAHDRAAAVAGRFAGTEHQLLMMLPAAQQALGAATRAARAFGPLAGQVQADDPQLVSVLRSGAELVDATTRFNRYAPPTLQALLPLLRVMLEPALSLPALKRYGEILSSNVNAYSAEWAVMGEMLKGATSYTFGGQPAIRVAGSIGGCTGGRDPYPAPGQSAGERRACADF